MLRDDSEVALNDLIKLADTAAETFETASRVVADHDADLLALFTGLAEQRRTMESELRSLDRSLGDLPREADDDYTAVHDLYVRLRGLFSGDERRALVEECESADQDLTAGLIAALQVRMPEPMVATLKRYQYEVTAALGRLAVVRLRM